jgi:hypothetical protein
MTLLFLDIDFFFQPCALRLAPYTLYSYALRLMPFLFGPVGFRLEITLLKPPFPFPSALQPVWF